MFIVAKVTEFYCLVESFYLKIFDFMQDLRLCKLPKNDI